jgi:hypothetical protein
MPDVGTGVPRVSQAFADRRHVSSSLPGP